MGENIETKIGQGTVKGKNGEMLTKGYIEIKGEAIIVRRNDNVDPRYACKDDPIQEVYHLKEVHITREY